MKKMFNKFVAVALAVCMICSFGVLSASAAAPYENGDYTATVAMLHESKDQPSMCNILFDHDADISVSNGKATVRLYVAYPVPAPAFSSQGVDGTVKDVVLTLNGVQYSADSDITSKPMREFDETNPSFGVEDGKAISTQVLSFYNIPAEQLDTLEAAPAKVEAYVNVAMNSTQIFRLQMTNIAQVMLPDEYFDQSMQITALVEAAAPSYSVVIPESVAMGTLSREAVNTTSYQVQVEATNLGSGKVVVSAPAEGKLTSEGNTLAYTNSFGTQETSVTATLKGAFTVTAEAVAAAAAGNYTGTANFAIAYYAGK